MTRFYVSKRAILWALPIPAVIALLIGLYCGESTSHILKVATEGERYKTISQAVQSADDGDIIVVSAGVYREQLELDKPLTLRPDADDVVVIDGECQRTNGIAITSSDVVVEGITVKKSIEAGVHIGSGAANVTLDRMRIQDYNCEEAQNQSLAGIAVRYSGPGVTITNSEITRRVELPGSPYGFGNGIWFKSDNTDPSGGEHYIADNTIIGGFDGIGGETEGDLHGSFDKDTIIEGNIISDCWDDGVQVEGGNAEVRVRYNRITGCAIGIALAPNLKGPLYIENNKILDLEPGFYGDATAFKLGRGDDQAIAYLTSNTVISDGDGIKQGEEGLPKLIARGNIIEISGYVLATVDPLPAGSLFDENCFWTTDDAGRFVKLADSRFSNLQSFQKATGHESKGRQNAECSSIVERR